MAIYLKISGINGDVTTKGFEKTIELSSADFQAKRSVSGRTGVVTNRAGTLPRLPEIRITKRTDRSSVALFEHACGKGNAIPKIEIHYCYTGSSIIPYAQYTFSDVIITNFHEVFDEMAEHPIEHISLDYSKVEKKFIPRNSSNKAESPLIAGYDKETSTLI